MDAGSLGEVDLLEAAGDACISDPLSVGHVVRGDYPGGDEGGDSGVARAVSHALEFATLALINIPRHRKAGDRGILKTLERLPNQLTVCMNPLACKPELLKYDMTGPHSRPITAKHRLVHRALKRAVAVLLVIAHGHYVIWYM